MSLQPEDTVLQDNQNRPSFLSEYPIDRTQLLTALSGDFALMVSLIEMWDNTSEKLIAKGSVETQKLNRADIQRSKELANLLANKKTPVKNKFLPQTYLSAAILLSIADPSELVALPSGLRQAGLFMPSQLDKIAFNIESLSSEQIYRLNPNVAFVGDYSHPGFVQNLNRQGINVCTIKIPNKIGDIETTILEIGKISDHQNEAELTCLFIKAAMTTIDNLVVESKIAEQNSPLTQLFYLTLYGQLTIPDIYSQTWQLFDRLKTIGMPIHLIEGQNNGNAPKTLSTESILHQNTISRLIVGIPSGEASRLSAAHKLASLGLQMPYCKVRLIDDQIQQSPTQHIAVAYYDLASSIIELLQE